jgi:hypothetical protein
MSQRRAEITQTHRILYEDQTFGGSRWVRNTNSVTIPKDAAAPFTAYGSVSRKTIIGWNSYK